MGRGTSGMKATQGRVELPDHVGERSLQRHPPSDQDVIVAGAECFGRRQPHHLAQAPPHAVAFHGIADLARHGEADPAGALVAARTRLHDKCGGRGTRAGGGSPKIRPAFQPFHQIRFGSPLTSPARRQSDRATLTRGRFTRWNFRRLASCALARGAPPKPCGRPWSPCGRGSRGGVCAPICSAGRSVSRNLSPLRALALKSAELARLIRKPSRRVKPPRRCPVSAAGPRVARSSCHARPPIE